MHDNDQERQNEPCRSSLKCNGADRHHEGYPLNCLRYLIRKSQSRLSFVVSFVAGRATRLLSFLPSYRFCIHILQLATSYSRSSTFSILRYAMVIRLYAPSARHIFQSSSHICARAVFCLLIIEHNFSILLYSS